jgi:hypothetical protein
MLPVRAFVDSRYLPGTTPGQHSWSALGSNQGEWRARLIRKLDAMPGSHLVFVQYDRIRFETTEWVYNEADIDRAKIIWVRDMGPEQNEQVLRYYPDRKPWLATPDDAPDALWPYDRSRSRATTVKPLDTEVCQPDPQTPPRVFKLHK